MKLMRKQKGQLVLTLILVMSVALAIGLSIIQKSLVDVSTSTKVEQSSRAFSAAEAGIEKALQVGSTTVEFENNSKSTVSDSGLLPPLPAENKVQDPLQFPPLAKEEIAQVWLTDYTSVANPPVCAAGKACYKQSSLDVYWGNSDTDQAALELTLVYYDGSKYQSRKWFLDSGSRATSNGFESVACSGFSLGNKNYQCKKTIGASPDLPLPSGLIMLRVRLLYNANSQPFAVSAVGSCGLDCSIPPQAKIFTSVGVSGDTQRTVTLFQSPKALPPYFDFAIFSAGEIKK